MTPQELLATVKGLISTGGKERKAIARLYDFVDRWLCDGEFSKCDEFLSLVMPAELNATVNIAILTITLAAKDKLKNRADYVVRVREYLVENKVDRIEHLLEGLE